MRELPHDPNIEVLPFEFGVCVVLVLVGCMLLGLTSCGTSYEPCVSYTDAEGREIKACVTITPREKEEKPDP